MSNNVHVVIMAGGSGTRFWPYSRDEKPKQFLDVIGTGRSLLQMTFDRFKEFTSVDNIWIVTNAKYKNFVHDQLPILQDQHILLEPGKRNTAPCIAYASYKILRQDPNAVMIVTPSDHAIFKEKEFERVIHTAISDASANNHLVTIGIRPNKPEIGYGYIQYLSEPEVDVKKVKTFTEKPQQDLAQSFLDSGDFLWNSGIFIWSIDSIVNAFEKHDEDIASLFASGLQDYFSRNEEKFIKEAYSQCKNISIDYAVMEKADNVYVIPGDFGWSDLGSWNALHQIRDKDENQNVVEGSVITLDSKDNFIRGEKNKLIVTQGIEGYVVADFDDVLLICKKEDSSVFKNVIADVRANKGEKYI